MTDAPPPRYFVVFHAPGPAWEPGVDFRDQPHVNAHVEYFAGQAGQGRIVLGGPFLDEESGGMMILRAHSQEEAERIARDDPGARVGFVTARVRPWLAALSSE